MNLFDLLFPSRCPLCGKIHSIKGEKGICKVCYRKLPVVMEPCCKHCGKPIADVKAEYCYDCEERDSSLSEGTALFVYTDQIKKAMAAFKYGGCQVDGAVYGGELLKHRGTKLAGWEIDSIIPVPLHRRRRWFRGYNQAEVIAEVIGEGLNIPLLTDCLERKRYTRPQNGLDNKKRMQNVQGAFKIHKGFKREQLVGRNILLVDDIYTTGATLEACAKLLCRQGVRNVYFACLCIGQDY